MTRLILPPPASTPEPADTPYSLGRVYAPDPRDARYPLREVVGRGSVRSLPSKRWRMGTGRRWIMQRGSTCVAHMAAHLRMLTPGLGALMPGQAYPFDPYLAYRWMQENDEWPGEEPRYYGTSIRAGCEYLRQHRHIGSYWWARRIDDVLLRLTLPKREGGGPLGVGVDWWTGFDDAPENGGWGTPTGRLRGGHGLVLFEYEAKTAKRPEAIVWGNSHEGNEEIRTTVEVAEYLLFQAGGEAVAVVEA